MKYRRNMGELKHELEMLDVSNNRDKQLVIDEIKRLIEDAGYEIVEQNNDKPWGAYFRLSNKQADVFVEEFFPGLTATEARLGNAEAELSPKFLIVSPEQRLSWQYHHHRAERWAFLTKGAYSRSVTDEPGDLNIVGPGHVVQFAQGERHRGVGLTDGYTVIAEIWQHTDPGVPSDEDDIVRLSDDYSR
jgi:mannose-6-phosphate isomerase-like protein (cupin superfamily)